ncbi:hypothetical protein [Pedobacter sp. KBW06]|uniref:hypothetical protein n=1 Tax=Pedobacter sp. KBW06 TaxID=2153359 RepID=UPI00131574E3|nr:hypothetical protein [Pedobacter sp. KBW06]
MPIQITDYWFIDGFAYDQYDKLRKKLLATGRQPLILDYYPPIIKTQYFCI